MGSLTSTDRRLATLLQSDALFFVPLFFSPTGARMFFPPGRVFDHVCQRDPKTGAAGAGCVFFAGFSRRRRTTARW